MSDAPVTVAELTATAIRVLCREIGPVNTARFLNQFSTGFGNYTVERDELIGSSTVDELNYEISKMRKQTKRSRKSVRKTP